MHLDLDLVDELYRRAYAEKVAGAERLRVLNASRVADVRSIARRSARVTPVA